MSARGPNLGRVYWLSFSGEHKFLGGCFVFVRAYAGGDSAGMKVAIEKARLLGINPGGEVLGVELPIYSQEDATKAAKALSPYIHRLLRTKAEYDEANGALCKALGWGDDEAQCASREEIRDFYHTGAAHRIEQEDFN